MATRLRICVVLIAGLVGCNASIKGGDNGKEERGRTIVNGSPTTGYPAVVQLLMTVPQGVGLCTGTLIRADTVLTARHCVSDASTVSVSAGSEAASATGWDSHPSADLALVHLGQSFSVAPMPLSSGAPEAGHPLTLVGFGQTSYSGSDYGVKRVATNTVSAVTAAQFQFSGAGQGNTCFGDSGGPAFTSSAGGGLVVLGVHEATIGQCVTGIDRRVDAYLDWIQQHVPGVTLESPLSPGSSPPDAGVPPPAPPTQNSCQGYCGGKAASCWCDTACTGFGGVQGLRVGLSLSL
jgi:V8-like Glu-specific endopeptidase